MSCCTDSVCPPTHLSVLPPIFVWHRKWEGETEWIWSLCAYKLTYQWAGKQEGLEWALKRILTEDTSWPQKYRRCTFLRQIWALCVAAVLICSLPIKSRERLAHDVVDACGTRGSLDYDIRDTDCQTQNGGAHGHILRLSLTNFIYDQLDQSWQKTCC